MTTPPPPPSYVEEVLADNPALYYRMDGQSVYDRDNAGNGGLADRSGFGRSASVNYVRCTAPSLIVGDSNPAGNMLVTNGNQFAYGHRAYGDWMQMSTFTLEAIIKVGTSGLHGLLSRDPQSGADRAWQWRLNANKLEFLNVTPADAGATVTATSATSVTSDTTRHVAVVVTPTTIQHYVDGLPDGPAVSHGGWRLTSTAQLDYGVIGSNFYWTSGVLDEVAVYSTALSDARIAAHHSAITAGTAPPAAYPATMSASYLHDENRQLIPTQDVSELSVRGTLGALDGARTTQRTFSFKNIEPVLGPPRDLVPGRQVNVTNRRYVVSAFKDSDPDWPVRTPGKAISGTVYGAGSLRIPGATVKLFRQHDDKFIREIVTDDGGNYVFVRDQADPYEYYVIAYTPAQTPQVHGMSDRGQVPQ